MANGKHWSSAFEPWITKQYTVVFTSLSFSYRAEFTVDGAKHKQAHSGDMNAHTFSMFYFSIGCLLACTHCVCCPPSACFMYGSVCNGISVPSAATAAV